MRQITALAVLILAAFDALASDAYTRARTLGLEMIAAELEGGFCTPASIPETKREEMSRTLGAVTQLGPTDATGLGPLSLAVLADDVPALIRLSALGYPLQSSGHLLLHDAALHDSRQSLSFLLGRNSNPDGVNANGATALMTAAANGRLAVAQILLSAGASPNVRNQGGGTALHYAIGCKDLAMVRALLAAGAVVDFNATALAQKHGLSLE